MSLGKKFNPVIKRVVSPKLTNNNYAHLRIFNDGLLLDLCIEPGANFGCLFPSLPLGQIIKLGSIGALKAKGMIEDETVIHYCVEYKRFSITRFGQIMFERYNNDISN